MPFLFNYLVLAYVSCIFFLYLCPIFRFGQNNLGLRFIELMPNCLLSIIPKRINRSYDGFLKKKKKTNLMMVILLILLFILDLLI